MTATKEQKAMILKHSTYYGFKFPCCNSEICNTVLIENPGEEDKTQIYCLYGCGFIYLEDY